jgi:uncharacterized membrane protein
LCASSAKADETIPLLPTHRNMTSQISCGLILANLFIMFPSIHKKQFVFLADSLV